MRTQAQSSRPASVSSQAAAATEITRTLQTAEELDARRRLEDRLEEIRLNRELKEFDFDFSM